MHFFFSRDVLRRTVWATRSAVLVLVVVLLSPCAADEASAAKAKKLRPGRLPKDVRKALVQGLSATFQAAQGTPPASDTRRQRLAAIFVPAGGSATPFLTPGPVRAKLSGYVKLKLRGTCLFSLRGRGSVRVWIGQKQVLAAKGDDFSQVAPVPVAMAKGYNALTIQYEGPNEGDAWLRLYWWSEEFPTEPLPPGQLFCDSREQKLRQGEVLRKGRELVALRGCLKCHEAPKTLGAVKKRGQVPRGSPETAGKPRIARSQSPFLHKLSSMPELAKDAPSLSEAGSRLTPTWMAHWILLPSRMRTGATMPATLAHLDAKEAAQKAVDLSAFLATLHVKKNPPAVGTAVDEDRIEQGEVLFENLGCIACHRVEKSDEPDEFSRTTLFYVGAKFQSGALAAFLRKPHAGYAWIRMPDFHLSEQESTVIAAYLRRHTTPKMTPPEDAGLGDAARGAKLFYSAGCVNCHEKGFEKKPTLAAPPLAKVKMKGGCLAEQSAARGNAPSLPLDAAQRAAVRAFLGTDLTSFSRRVLPEASTRMVRAIHCAACHRRDGEDCDLPSILIDEGNQGLHPEILPTLTWAGEKLKVRWTQQMLAGRLPYRSRNWMKARMPAFASRAPFLAAGLSAEHGYAPSAVGGPSADPVAASLGQGLIEKNRGFNCVQCHAVGQREPLGVTEARGINLLHAKHRLRYDYFPRWMLHPQRVDSMTKMPRLAPDGKKTPLTHVYEGDARRQFNAIWHFIQTLEPRK